jgi:short-subunit dehydrogenase
MNFVGKAFSGLFGGVWYGLRKTVFTIGNKRPRRLCYAVGLFTVGHNIYDMTYATVIHNRRAPINYADVYGKGTWVVISGAVDPIG